MQPGNFVRQDRGLIEPARGQTRPMQGYRHQQICFSQQFLTGGRKPPAEQAAAIVLVGVFDLVHEIANDAGEMGGCTCTIIIRWIGQSCRRHDDAARRKRHRNTEPVAHGRADEIDAAPALRAECIVSGEWSVAAQADRRQKKICDCAPSGRSKPAKVERNAAPVAGRYRVWHEHHFGHVGLIHALHAHASVTS